MILDISWEEESIPETEQASLAEILERAISEAIRLAEGPEESEVSLTLVDDEKIHVLNRDYRGVDRPTDVLSFALQEESEDEPGIFDFEDDILGDIVISVARARLQAVEYGHSFERELAYLAVHGTLHLLGYDHEEPADQEKMRAKEEEVMTHIGLERA